MKQSLKYNRIRLPVRLRLIWCLVLLRLLATDPALAAGPTVVDDLGATVSLERPARRIIALYGSFNEILAAMGLSDRIVARTNTDRLPPTIVKKPSIGTHMRPNVELVLGYRPDLVLQMAGRKEALQTTSVLKQFGLTVAFFRVTTFEQLFSVIKRVGLLTGEPEAAQILLKSMQNRLDAVAGSTAPFKTRPQVFFEVRYPNLLGAGQGSIVNDIINRAGGQNCVASPKKLFRLNEEALLRLNPDVYLIQQGPMNPAPKPILERPHYRTLKAVRNDRVHLVDEQIFSRPGPRSVDAVEMLSAWLVSGSDPGRTGSHSQRPEP